MDVFDQFVKESPKQKTATVKPQEQNQPYFQKRQKTGKERGDEELQESVSKFICCWIEGGRWEKGKKEKQTSANWLTPTWTLWKNVEIPKQSQHRSVHRRAKAVR